VEEGARNLRSLPFPHLASIMFFAIAKDIIDYL
jgi:hypothetical protein